TTEGIAVIVPFGAEDTMNRSPRSPKVSPAAWLRDLPSCSAVLENRKPPSVSTGTRLTIPYGVAELAVENTARDSGGVACAAGPRPSTRTPSTPTALAPATIRPGLTGAPPSACARSGVVTTVTLVHSQARSQVCLLDCADPHSGSRCPAERDPALLQHVDAIGDVQCPVHELFDEQDREPGPVQLDQSGQDLVDDQ